MKKKNNIFIKLFRPLVKIFDKILIRPVTKLILRLRDWANSVASIFDKMSNNKSFLLFVSLILAFGSFIIIDRERDVAMDQYAEIMYNQPVTAVYNDVQYVIEGLPETVDITLIGQKRHIFLAKQSPSKGVTVDLTGLKPGEHKVKLKYSQGLKSLEYKLDPSEVTITIYEKVSASKSLTYDILHSDELDSKLYINKVTLDRSEVIVKGSQKSLDKVASVRALIDVRDIPKDATGEITLDNVSLVAYDTNGKIINVEVIPKTITAKLQITSPQKEVPIKVVPTGDVALGKSIKSIETNISKVTVYGKSSVVNNMDSLTVKVNVDELNADKTFNITLEKPDGITELSENQITVTVRLDQSDSKVVEGVRIRTENLADNYSVNALSANDSTVNVKVTGSSEAIKNITADNIKAYVDLKNAKVGENKLKVKVTGDDVTLNYEIVNNKTITVVVTEPLFFFVL